VTTKPSLPSSPRVVGPTARSSTRLTIAAGTAATVVYMIGIATVLPSDNPQEWSVALSSQPIRAWTSVIAFSTAAIAGASLLLLLARDVIGPSRKRAHAGAAIAAVGFVLNAVGTPIAYAAATGQSWATSSARVERARTTVDLLDAANVGLLGVGLLLLIVAQRASGTIGTPLALLGAVTATASMAGATAVIAPAADPLRLIAGLLTLVWIIAATTRAARPRRP